MKFTTTERKIKVNQKIHEYAEKKISKLDRFFRDEATASIVYSIEKERHIIELTISSGGLIFRVNEATSDMRASIDSAVATVERQIRKHKTRISKRLRDGVLEFEQQPEITLNSEPAYKEPEFNIVRSKTFSLKPMSPEEAILQMNLLDHEFFVFRNQNNNDTFSVVYKRFSGDYGLIESED